MTILAEAAEVIADRMTTYGPPEEHWGRTAGALSALWAKKLREPLTAKDWAMAMVVDKLAREQHSHHRDNITDGIGYLAGLDRIGGET